MREPNICQLRLTNVLRRQKERWGSFDRLAREIAKVAPRSRDKQKKGIDRRKLKDLVDGVDVPLKISELKALDAYLGPLGEGLSVKPLFEQPGILAALSESAEVVFLVGSYPREGVPLLDLSSWDIRSIADMLRDLNHYTGSFHFNIEEAVFAEQKKGLSEKVKQERWYARLEADEYSLVSIGSPRVCHATEVMLAKMFDIEPFKKPRRASRPLPFCFIWPDDRLHFTSSFADNAESIRDINLELSTEILTGKRSAMGLKVRDEVLAVRRDGLEERRVGAQWSTYGVIAAQRRRTGEVWLAISGLTGSATYAASRAVKTIAEGIPPSKAGAHSPILWAIVEAQVELESMPGDPRRVLSQAVIDGPNVWPPRAAQGR